jgi:nitrite reductase/ring-hydroxylating ferredoxin subunit
VTAPVCEADALAPGEKLVIERGRRRILLCRAADGSLYAVGGLCPHQGAALEHGTLDGTAVAAGVGGYGYGLDCEVLRCPWHGWEFDIKSGRALFGERSAQIATYRVTVEDGAVFVAESPIRTKGEQQ